MLDLTIADIRQTRFYQEVFQEGREKGREEGREEGEQIGTQKGEAATLIRLLVRRFGPLPEAQMAHIQE